LGRTSLRTHEMGINGRTAHHVSRNRVFPVFAQRNTPYPQQLRLLSAQNILLPSLKILHNIRTSLTILSKPSKTAMPSPSNNKILLTPRWHLRPHSPWMFRRNILTMDEYVYLCPSRQFKHELINKKIHNEGTLRVNIDFSGDL